MEEDQDGGSVPPQTDVCRSLPEGPGLRSRSECDHRKARPLSSPHRSSVDLLRPPGLLPAEVPGAPHSQAGWCDTQSLLSCKNFEQLSTGGAVWQLPVLAPRTLPRRLWSGSCHLSQLLQLHRAPSMPLGAALLILSLPGFFQTSFARGEKSIGLGKEATTGM